MRKMNLQELEKIVKKIDNDSELLIRHYKNIVLDLNNVYKLVPKDNPLSKKVNDLINRYNDLIREMSTGYTNVSNLIRKYINNSNQNLIELEQNITNIVHDLNNML